MSDEPKSDDTPNGAWTMPEPVYRTSPGHTPRGLHETEVADEIPTDPGFTDEDNVDTLAPGYKLDEEIPTSESIKVMPAPPKPKGGCARSFLTMVGIVVLAVIGMAIALIYFIFYYKSADTSTF